jgi:hypothetical protein
VHGALSAGQARALGNLGSGGRLGREGSQYTRADVLARPGAAVSELGGAFFVVGHSEPWMYLFARAAHLQKLQFNTTLKAAGQLKKNPRYPYRHYQKY